MGEAKVGGSYELVSSRLEPRCINNKREDDVQLSVIELVPYR